MGVTSAASINLNLLSADFYALLFGIFLFKYQFHVLYLISFCLIIVGIVVYSIWPAPVTMDTDYSSVQSSSNIQTSSADSVREAFHLEIGDTRQTSSSSGSSVDKTECLLSPVAGEGEPGADVLRV
ncbi:hypothetical protein NP493_419g07015 [Ridgeia piscesae]|uniref:Uncharacterized protein n=1 Tax=Ridgeia piscesae TaxID=27915 RepID=A0AAD9L0U6_RIDPI|nr:hypothetical protein NP493_419g07015 [Ridgeia piscesae]